MEQTEKNKTVIINLTPRARLVVDGIREDSGVPNTEAMARILEWFAKQDRKVRMAILTKEIESQRELVALALTEMIGEEARTAEYGPLDQLDIEQLAKLQAQVSHHISKRAAAMKTALASRGGEKKKG